LEDTILEEWVVSLRPCLRTEWRLRCFDRLQEVGQIQADFDPVGWTKKLQAKASKNGKKRVVTSALDDSAWIILREDFVKAQAAFSKSAAMGELNKRKPDKPQSVAGKKLEATFTVDVEDVKISHVMSTPWPCQLDHRGVPIPDDKAQLSPTVE